MCICCVSHPIHGVLLQYPKLEHQGERILSKAQEKCLYHENCAWHPLRLRFLCSVLSPACSLEESSDFPLITLSVHLFIPTVFILTSWSAPALPSSPHTDCPSPLGIVPVYLLGPFPRGGPDLSSPLHLCPVNGEHLFILSFFCSPEYLT